MRIRNSEEDVPGGWQLRVTFKGKEGEILRSACLDPGNSLPRKIRQAQFV